MNATVQPAPGVFMADLWQGLAWRRRSWTSGEKSQPLSAEHKASSTLYTHAHPFSVLLQESFPAVEGEQTAKQNHQEVREKGEEGR